MKRHAGIDITEMYPAGGPPNKELADNWNWDTFLTAAMKCFAAGSPNGLPAAKHFIAAVRKVSQFQLSASSLLGGPPAGYISVMSIPAWRFIRSRSEERRVGEEGRSRWSPDH